MALANPTAQAFFPDYYPFCPHGEWKYYPTQLLCWHSWRHDLPSPMSTEDLQNHPAMIPSKGTKFLDLPLEVQLIIFRNVLRTPSGDGILVMKTSCSSTRRVELHFAAVEPRRGKGTDWELGTYHLTHAQMTWSFMICRALYREQMNIFYSENKFVFASFRDMGKFLRRIGPSRRKHIGSVVICDDTSYGDLDPGHQYQQKSEDPLITLKAAREAWTLLGESQYLRRLEIRFEEYVNIAFPEIHARRSTTDFPMITGSSGKVGTDRMIDEEEWEWHYTDVEEFRRLPGINIVKRFRGLSQVVVVERRNLLPLRAENNEYVAKFKAMLTSNKKLNTSTKENQVPALAIRQLQETSTSVMTRVKQRPGDKLTNTIHDETDDVLQRFKLGQDLGYFDNLKLAHKLEHPIALWEERIFSPRKGRALSSSFCEEVTSICEVEKHVGPFGPRQIQAGNNWISSFQNATDFRRQHKSSQGSDCHNVDESDDGTAGNATSNEEIGADNDEGDWLVENSRGRDWQDDYRPVFDPYAVDRRWDPKKPCHDAWESIKLTPDGSYQNGRVFDCGLDVPEGYISVGTSRL
ncbi:hypothetical protein MMC17_002812 [Xylographa soralifera]|nr:hypothetical protein [Xylographa soralifera]